MAKFCPNCGNPVNNTSNFCEYCGEALSAYGVETTYSPYTPDRGVWQMFFQFKGRLNPKRFFIRATVVYLIWFFLMLVVTLLSPKSSYKSLEPIIALSSFIPFFMMIPLCVRRSHDLGRPGWYFIIMSIPFLAVAAEFFVERWGWHTIWGEYRERWRITETSVVVGAIALIIMSFVAVLVFMFTGGTHGDNEYGPDPTGTLADTPPNANPILNAITRLEENVSSWAIIGIAVALCVATELLATAVNKINSSNVASKPAYSVNTPQQNNNRQTDIATNNNRVKPPEVKVPEIKVPPQPEKIEVPKVNVPQPNNPKNQATNFTATQQAAISTLESFHGNITRKDYRQAYDCLSENFKQRMSYTGWADGFGTTISSEVNDVKVWSEKEGQIVLTYNLKAVDKMNGKQKITNFSGTAVMIKENGAWKINEVTNKLQ
ncbi:MAG: DUF805 domain-containing protein [Selenomonadaceae bacterium]|nr:DUF805 domain-containing protein [Selenomonadaceae bacterium]